MKLAELKAHMEKTIEATQRSLNTIRTGRANVSLLDRVMVEYYGAETPLKSLATLSTPVYPSSDDRTSKGCYYYCYSTV